jgi:hypothetical protein
MLLESEEVYSIEIGNATCRRSSGFSQARDGLANPGRVPKYLLRVMRGAGAALQQSGAHSIFETPEL